MKGVESLTDIELLAIFLRSGSKKHNVIELSEIIYNSFLKFSSFKNVTLSELNSYDGIGKVKAIEILSLFELVKRISSYSPRKINNIYEANKFIHSNIDIDSSKEQFILLLLNYKNEILHYKKIYIGTKREISIEPIEVLSLALKYEAKKFYCFHNHPSGDLSASIADQLITSRLQNYSKLFGIEMIGHFISNSQNSFRIIKTN